MPSSPRSPETVLVDVYAAAAKAVAVVNIAD
jgi:hypothetical protein